MSPEPRTTARSRTRNRASHSRSAEGWPASPCASPREARALRLARRLRGAHRADFSLRRLGALARAGEAGWLVARAEGASATCAAFRRPTRHALHLPVELASHLALRGGRSGTVDDGYRDFGAARARRARARARLLRRRSH